MKNIIQFFFLGMFEMPIFYDVCYRNKPSEEHHSDGKKRYVYVYENIGY